LGGRARWQNKESSPGKSVGNRFDKKDPKGGERDLQEEDVIGENTAGEEHERPLTHVLGKDKGGEGGSRMKKTSSRGEGTDKKKIISGESKANKKFHRFRETKKGKGKEIPPERRGEERNEETSSWAGKPALP